jgi:hypothetical protein
MCTRTDCDVLAHRKLKVSQESFGGTLKELVFIQVPPQGGKHDSSGVYLTPNVLADAFDGARLEVYLSEERTVDQWTSFFASLEATPNPTTAEKIIIAERFEQPPPVAAFTPRSGRLVKRKAESPEPDQDSEFAFVESEFEMVQKELLGPDKLAENVGLMSKHWRNLVTNEDTLLHLCQLNHKAGLILQEKSEVDLADLEFATSLVATKVGDRPATLGTDSLFKLVEDVVDDVGKLHKAVSTLENPELAAARDLQLGVKIGQEIVGHLNPVFRLFSLLSRTKEAPGDILEERLHALESRSIHATSFAPAPTVTSAPAWPIGNNTQGRNLQTSPTEEALTARVLFLETQLKDMQDEMTAQSVQIGTVTFVSRTMVRAWMDQTRCPPRTCIFFLDAMSVLALMHGGYESAQSAAEFASITKKVGYETTEEALVVTSFNLELPEAFGSLPKTGVAKDSRVLPGLPTFKEWDGGDGYLGLKVELANKLGEFMIPMGQHYRQCLSGEALIVAMEMIASSKLFISDLSTWINTTYQDTRARTMASEKEAWSLISHCVRVIFKLLRDARSSGARWTLETRDAQMVWAQFQCHRLMEELRLAQFSAHPALSHVLNLHLQDNVVSRSRYETLEKKVTEIAKIANEAKKAADKAIAAKK